MLLAGLLLVEAVVTAVLNLDTAVVFMTPVLLHAARARGLREDPFLYGAIFMANAASLLLPGSNLTNLIVLAHEPPVTGSAFASHFWAAWLVSVAITIAFVALVLQRGEGLPAADEVPPFRPRVGAAGVLGAAVLVLTLAQPALPVLALGIAVAIVARTSPRVVNPLLPPHPRALLLGLDLGPNLVVTGSLSAIFWLQVARADGARPSIRRYSRLGVVFVPLTLCAALLVTHA